MIRSFGNFTRGTAVDMISKSPGKLSDAVVHSWALLAISGGLEGASYWASLVLAAAAIVTLATPILYTLGPLCVCGRQPREAE